MGFGISTRGASSGGSIIHGGGGGRGKSKLFQLKITKNACGFHCFL